ncbi:Uncharacterised protein [Raoultella ornithinolytica]|nr:Uncharacterised protein [Raoultella ornithinolytica]
MLLLHEVRHQRLRNRIILAVALLAAIASISPEQLGITLYKLSLVSHSCHSRLPPLIEHCFLTPARGAI